MTMHLKVLGCLALTGDGRPVTGAAAQRRSLAMLAVLSGNGPRGIPREKLAALLWPESDQDDARNCLKQTVYLLRRELGSDAVLGSAELRLDAQLVSCDRVTFQRLLAQGELAAAVEAYTGPFLDGFHFGGDSRAFERWVDGERARLARQYRDALEALATEATSRGAHAAALSWWHRLADLEPLGGRNARGIVTSLLALGDRPAALRHAEIYRTLLAAELGLSPDAELAELIATIRVAPRVSHPVNPLDPSVEPAPARAAPRAGPGSRRRLTWMSVAATFTIVALLAAVGRARLHRPPRPHDPRRVAIIALEPVGNDAPNTSSSHLLVESIARRLTAAAVAAPVVLSLAPGRDARAAAQRAGAGTIVTVARSGNPRDVIETAMTDAATGEQLWGVRQVWQRPGSPGAADSLAERIATAVATRLDPKLRFWIDVSSRPATLASYQEFSLGMALFADLKPEVAVIHFRSAASDTGFTMALIMAAWASYSAGEPRMADSIARSLLSRTLQPLDRAMVDHQLQVYARDLHAEYTAAAAVAAVAPHSEWRYLLAESALKVGRAGEASRVLEEVGPDLGWLSTYPGYWMLLGRALHFAGAHERELAAMREAQRRFPTNRIITQHLIKALAALGRVADVEREIDRGLTLNQSGTWSLDLPMAQAIWELRAHGHPDPARRLARRGVAWVSQQSPDDRRNLGWALMDFLYEAGDRRESRLLATQLLEEAPDDLELVAFVGQVSAELGDEALARRIDAQLAGISDPRLLADVLISRAGIAARLGQRDAAVRMIQEACRRGFVWRSVLHYQPSMDPLRGYPPYEAVAGPVD